MAKSKQPTPQAQRATVKNPTSKEYPKDVANTKKQIESATKSIPKKGK